MSRSTNTALGFARAELNLAMMPRVVGGDETMSTLQTAQHHRQYVLVRSIFPESWHLADAWRCDAGWRFYGVELFLFEGCR